MLAVAFDTFGGPEVLHLVERPEPAPKKGEVVVKVAAATVNPTDTSMRAGRQAASMTELKPPFIAGMEIRRPHPCAREGVTTLKVGQAVMGIVSPRAPGGRRLISNMLPFRLLRSCRLRRRSIWPRPRPCR